MNSTPGFFRLYALCGIVVFIPFVIALFTVPVCADQELDKRIELAKKEKRIVMLELGSVGCIPCENMKPVMEKLTQTYKGKLDVIFVDVKKDRDGARKFNVYGIPTQVFLDTNGREFHRHIGFYPYDQIVPVLRKAGI